MVTANKTMGLAAAELGVVENNNRIKYNQEYYGRNVYGSSFPYCCVFVWCIFKKAGASKLFYDGKKTAYCPEAVNWFKKKKQWHTYGYRPADVVFFDWGKDGVADHVGFIEKVNPDGSFTTIEGNTENPANRQQEGVFRRIRYASQIMGVGRPDYDKEENEMTKTEGQAMMQEMLKNYITKAAFDELAHEVLDDSPEPSFWAVKEWEEAKKLGICDGTNPQKLVTREQAVAMALRAYKLGKMEL